VTRGMSSSGRRRIPMQSRSRQKVDAILDGAAQVLVQVGFEKASTNRIARASGVSIGTLYQYFDCKEAVCDALAERTVERVLNNLTQALAPARDFEGVFEALRRRAAESLPTTPALLRLLSEVPESGMRVRLDAAKPVIAELLVRAMKRQSDSFPGLVDLEDTAMILVNAGEGLLLSEQAGDWPELVRQAERLTLRLVTGNG